VSLRQLKSLERLFLHGNNVLTIPAEVLGPTGADFYLNNAQQAKPSEILEYYFRVLGDRRPLNETKLILVIVRDCNWRIAAFAKLQAC
jgi:hypothetical protein